MHRLGPPASLALLVSLALLSGLASAPRPAVGAEARPTATLILADGLELAELLQALDARPPGELLALRALIDQAAWGLMNTRTAGNSGPGPAHLTIGAGARADAAPESGLFLEPAELVEGEPVSALYEARTGYAAPSGGGLFLDLPETLARNSRLGYPVIPGALGGMLGDAGLRVAVIGNADVPGTQRRYAGLIGMDRRGQVASAAVGAPLVHRDPTWPAGYRTDRAALLRALERAYAAADLLIVDTGDLSRLEAVRPSLLPRPLAAARRSALATLDAALATWARLARPHDVAIVLSPSPRGDHWRAGHYLTPIALWTKAAPPARAGLLTSSTTHRLGLVSNMDVAPTVLALLCAQNCPSARKTSLGGAPLLRVSSGDPLPFLLALFDRAARVHDWLPILLKAYAVLCIAVFVLATVLFYGVHRLGWKSPSAWRHILLAVSAGPLAFLLMPAIDPPTLFWASLTASSLMAATAAAASRLSRWVYDPYLGVIGLTALLLLYDLGRGAPWMQASLLGYDVMGGARYYGIGNEFMGVLIGSVIVAGALAVDRFGRRPTVWAGLALVGAAASLAMAAPGVGANIGGAITACLGFGLNAFWLSGRSVKARSLLLLGMIAGLTVAAAAAYDLTARTADPSHLGRLVRDVTVRGPVAFTEVAARKVAMNLKLIRWTIWSRVLLASAAALLVLFTRPHPFVARVFARTPALYQGIKGATAASLIALAVNDSGVVAAATALIPATTVLLDAAARAPARERLVREDATAEADVG